MGRQDVTIYGLCEPGTTAVRYVGKTRQSLERRLAEHLSEAASAPAYVRNAKVCWLRALVAEGRRPDVMALDSGDDDTWADLERFHIRSHRMAGFALVNSSRGGEEGGMSVATIKEKEDAIARAIYDSFISPNVSDSNFEAAGLVDTTQRMAGGLWAIARAIDNLAAAIRGMGNGPTGPEPDADNVPGPGSDLPF